jgi:DNA-directed RNA polymerase specialized sigma24 family protein
MSTSIDGSKPDARVSSADRVWSEFMAALDALAPDVRAAFLLHEIFEASYDDIARLIGEPADTCRNHVEHAREHALARMHSLGNQEKAPLQ